MAELRDRLEGCEAVLRGLKDLGILDRPEEEHRSAKTGRRSAGKHLRSAGHPP